jgi:hypothetical protein
MTASYQRGVSPRQGGVSSPVTERLCHREVGWRATGGEWSVRRMTNLFRPFNVASTHVYCEAQKRAPADKAIRSFSIRRFLTRSLSAEN